MWSFTFCSILAVTPFHRHLKNYLDLSDPPWNFLVTLPWNCKTVCGSQVLSSENNDFLSSCRSNSRWSFPRNDKLSTDMDSMQCGLSTDNLFQIRLSLFCLEHSQKVAPTHWYFWAHVAGFTEFSCPRSNADCGFVSTQYTNESSSGLLRRPLFSSAWSTWLGN